MSPMFCYQCEQTGAKGTACTIIGICGKEIETAALHDLILYLAKGIAMYLHRARQLNATEAALDNVLLEALFYTVTNVNFDVNFLADYITRSLSTHLQQAKQLYQSACLEAKLTPELLEGPAAFEPAQDLAALVHQGRAVSIQKDIEKHGEDITGLQELLTYGLKGTAAYAHHARALGYESEDFYAFLAQSLNYLTQEVLEADVLFDLCLQCGQMNLQVMALLDTAHTTCFGHPEPTAVAVTPVKGHCILVSGHELNDLASLLEATAGTGINIYTHGELLPAHGYPGLKKHAHLVGHYGGAWQNQGKEFRAFPGAILMTTNCLQKPLHSYQKRLFTTGLVGWQGIQHVNQGHWQPVIDAALAEPGFSQTEPAKTITVGFGHHALTGKLVNAVKQGAVRRLFLIGGCDGAKVGRNYYTTLARFVPDDCAILTFACGKYRLNQLELGEINGIPRLLDVGQCNDIYSVARLMTALTEELKVDQHRLPISFMISWYEQKMIAVLLTLLHLGVKNIYLGPTLPAFITPMLLEKLEKTFALKLISTAEADLKTALA